MAGCCTKCVDAWCCGPQERQGQDVQRLLRSHRASARRADGKAKKQQKKKVRRQTGRAQAGAVAQGGRPLDKYAWLQVGPSCLIMSISNPSSSPES